MGENFEDILDAYFEELKLKMRNRIRTVASLVMKHYNDVCFLVDTNNTFIHAVKPRKAWLKPFGYGVEGD